MHSLRSSLRRRRRRCVVIIVIIAGNRQLPSPLLLEVTVTIYLYMCVRV